VFPHPIHDIAGPSWVGVGYLLLVVGAVAAALLIWTVTFRSDQWRQGNLTDRLFLAYAAATGAGIAAYIAIFLRVFIATIVVLDPGLRPENPWGTPCSIDDCFADIRNYAAILMVIGAPVLISAALGIAILLTARGWWRLVGVALGVPVIAVVSLALEILHTVPLSAAVPDQNPATALLRLHAPRLVIRRVRRGRGDRRGVGQSERIVSPRT
jgi:hypothetical protein